MSHKTDAAITEILNMSAGKGMDELILEKIFGYEKLPPPACPKFQKPTDDGVVSMFFIPPYSTTISAAWLVVEKMGEWHGFEFVIRRCRYEKTLWEAGWFDEGWEGYESIVSDFAETPALAICRAALLIAIEEKR